MFNYYYTLNFFQLQLHLEFFNYNYFYLKVLIYNYFSQTTSSKQVIAQTCFINKLTQRKSKRDYTEYTHP